MVLQINVNLEKRCMKNVKYEKINKAEEKNNFMIITSKITQTPVNWLMSEHFVVIDEHFAKQTLCANCQSGRRSRLTKSRGFLSNSSFVLFCSRVTFLKIFKLSLQFATIHIIQVMTKITLKKENLFQQKKKKNNK